MFSGCVGGRAAIFNYKAIIRAPINRNTPAATPVIVGSPTPAPGSSLVGVAVGLGFIVGVGLTVGFAVGDGVGLGVGEGVDVACAIKVGAGVGDGVTIVTEPDGVASNDGSSSAA